MVDHRTVMESGRCMEYGAKEIDGFSCYELFGFPLVWGTLDLSKQEVKKMTSDIRRSSSVHGRSS
ncbi:hypothetical protein DP091_28105 [Paenibacillus sp. MDMC362]|nr:hypothetical protein DP091_28105 [Paenibacillus sp. MDMC362]